MSFAKKNGYIKLAIIIVILIITWSSYHLFLNFITGIYVSDYPAHIQTVLLGNAGYSLMHKLIGVCYALPSSARVLALLMSIIVLGTCIIVYRYLYHRIGDMCPGYILMIIALALLFTSNLYIPRVFEHFYNHYTKVSQPWHNSTYLLMRLFSIWVVLLYFKLYDQATENEFHLKDGLLFCVILSLCNFAKPNFFLAFAPASLLVFLYLFAKFQGKNIKNLFKWGCCYLLSIPCLFYMVSVVYDETEQSKVAFSSENLVDYLFGNAGVGISHGQFIVCEISNLIFPLFVLGVFLVLRFRNIAVELNRVIQGFLLFFISHLEQLLMIDDGPRRASGNYAWGVYCFGMILFMICIAEWIRAYRKNYMKNKIVFMVGTGIFSIQILCGIIYYVMLTQGLGYVL